MRTVTEESLRHRLARLESALESEGTLELSMRRHPLGSRDEAYQRTPHSEGRTN